MTSLKDHAGIGSHTLLLLTILTPTSVGIFIQTVPYLNPNIYLIVSHSKQILRQYL